MARHSAEEDAQAGKPGPREEPTACEVCGEALELGEWWFECEGCGQIVGYCCAGTEEDYCLECRS